MPRKGLKVVVDLTIQAVTCPGTVLKQRDDIYLSVVFFGQQKRTLCLPPVFPLLFHQLLRFERTFPHCLDPAHLSHILAEDRILIEIIQLNEDYSQDGTVLALYETSMREFLYPEDSLAPSYTDSEREVLMQRTIWFSAISPKLEFCCSTTVSDVSTPTSVRYSELVSQFQSDEDERDIITIKPSRRRSRSRSRRRTKSYEVSTVSSRSKSPTPRLSSTMLEDRPPFIMKRRDTKNRALSPARKASLRSSMSLISNGTSSAGNSRLSLSPKRPQSAPVSRRKVKAKVDSKRSSKNGYNPGVYISERDCKICGVYRKYVGKRYWGHKKYYHPNHGVDLSANESNGHLNKAADKWLRKQIELDEEDTNDLLRSLNHLSLSTVTSPEPIAGHDVEYARLPYSPRSRSPSPLLQRSLRSSRSPRSTSPSRLQSSLRSSLSTLHSPRSSMSTLHSPRSYQGRRSRSASPRRELFGETSFTSRTSDYLQNGVEDFLSDTSDVSSVTSEEALTELRSTLRKSGNHSDTLTRSLLGMDRRYSHY